MYLGVQMSNFPIRFATVDLKIKIEIFISNGHILKINVKQWPGTDELCQNFDGQNFNGHVS